MDDYKLVFIYGQDDPKRKFSQGQIHYYGKTSDDLLHIVHLLNYVKEYYNDFPILQRLTLRHPKEIVAYFLLQMGHVVFFNTTDYDEKKLKCYGKSGLLFIPDNLTKIQEARIKEFLETIEDYDILINYNITLEEGVLNSETYQSGEKNPPSILFEKFLKSKKETMKSK